MSNEQTIWQTVGNCMEISSTMKNTWFYHTWLIQSFIWTNSTTCVTLHLCSLINIFPDKPVFQPSQTLLHRALSWKNWKMKNYSEFYKASFNVSFTKFHKEKWSPQVNVFVRSINKYRRKTVFFYLNLKALKVAKIYIKSCRWLSARLQ